MRSETVIGRQQHGPRAWRRLPFFRIRWNETYGWQVAVIITALVGCTIAFWAIAESVTEGDVITTWDARLTQWFNDNSLPSLTRATEIYTHAGSGLWLVAVAAVAVAFLWSRHGWADALLVTLAAAGALVVNPLFKEFFSRPRPSLHDPHLTLSTFSFPSGHS